ncbi:response regulator transcription factor [Ideonella sp. 4Y16]|uniref:response regulator transcription factor n=1 Tax=Ideonella alba TaxID=2824118 RepID=UPI001B35DF04|nr:response regulator transcription factor [Ideonella alba]MBQ0944804.1 response regulator transcription factor [Ideonella alba]
MNAADVALVVEDHPLYRQALLDTLQATLPGWHCLAASTLAEARLALAQSPRLVLADQRLPDGEGLAWLATLAGQVPLRLLLSGADEPRLILHARQCGLDAYLPKRWTPPQISDALHRVLQGQRCFPSASGGDDAPLTARQLEVLRLVGRGLPSREIAQRLGVTERTVKDHLSLIFIRLGVRNRAEAVAQASVAGWLVFDSAE